MLVLLLVLCLVCRQSYPDFTVKDRKGKRSNSPNQCYHPMLGHEAPGSSEGTRHWLPGKPHSHLRLFWVQLLLSTSFQYLITVWEVTSQKEISNLSLLSPKLVEINKTQKNIWLSPKSKALHFLVLGPWTHTLHQVNILKRKHSDKLRICDESSFPLSSCQWKLVS